MIEAPIPRIAARNTSRGWTKLAFSVPSLTISMAWTAFSYMLVVGEREAAEGKVAVRLRSGKDLGPMPLETVIKRLKMEAESRVDVAE